MLENTFKVDES